ncbi:MAG: hypothetical protein ACUVRK_05785 [Spirochaetota bacterium]
MVKDIKKVNKSDLGDNGKAYYGMLAISQIKGLNIFGTYRNQVTDYGDASNNYNRYMACADSYSLDMIKLGARYVIPKKVSPCVEYECTLFDSWLLGNFQTVVQIPIIISGRYAFGKDNSNSKVTVWAAGIGLFSSKAL